MHVLFREVNLVIATGLGFGLGVREQTAKLRDLGDVYSVEHIFEPLLGSNAISLQLTKND